MSSPATGSTMFTGKGEEAAVIRHWYVRSFGYANEVSCTATSAYDIKLGLVMLAMLAAVMFLKGAVRGCVVFQHVSRSMNYGVFWTFYKCLCIAYILKLESAITGAVLSFNMSLKV